MSKVYLAGPWAYRKDMPEIAAAIEAAGHTITFKWWEVEDIAWGADALAVQAERDANGVRKCDILVLINTAISEGKSFEQGMAYALGKRLVAVGKRGEHSHNIFHALPVYRWFPTIQEAIHAI